MSAVQVMKALHLSTFRKIFDTTRGRGMAAVVWFVFASSAVVIIDRMFSSLWRQNKAFKYSLGPLLDHEHVTCLSPILHMRYTPHLSGREDCFVPRKFENLVRFSKSCKIWTSQFLHIRFCSSRPTSVFSIGFDRLNYHIRWSKKSSLLS